MKKEYPRPQMVRDRWMNLNGTWEFEYDFGNSGIDREFQKRDKFSEKILVPFCPESELSGHGYKDFMNSVWYRRNFKVPSDWNGGHILLNFEAVDYECRVWVNGVLACTHKGGYTPFSADITNLLSEGENIIVVNAKDDCRTGKQPAGKQIPSYYSKYCRYTRVTGIWQTVWLEHVPITYVKSYHITSDIYNSKADLTVFFNDATEEKEITVKATYEGKVMGEITAKTYSGVLQFSVPLEELYLWEPLDAKLYDLEISLVSNNEVDRISGYFGMRSLRINDKCILINDKPVFQKLVLDQGYYPKGIYTAKNDEELKRDIELSIKLGFNGARMHQKVFERRYIYYADKYGYLLWGEYANYALDHTKAEALEIYLPEWLESVERDFNSPAIIGWCPFNETWDYEGRKQDDDVIYNIYNATKVADPTRPVIDTSGNYHVETDIYDIHAYEQDTKKFEEFFKPMATGGEPYDNFSERQKYMGQPYFISEYGGIWWSSDKDEGWGYGNRPKTEEEFVERFCSLTRTLIQNPNIFALCYTQLYDVEQETNGIYDYDRNIKFSKENMEKLREVMIETAAIEKQNRNTNSNYY